MAPSRNAAGLASAFEESFAIRVVVIGQLFALSDGARRANPDDAVFDVDVTIGPARMIDEPRDVAADVGVDHRTVRQLETPDVAGSDVAQFALEAFLVRDLLAGVVDDALVLGDGLGGEHAPPVNLRSPFLNHPY